MSESEEGGVTCFHITGGNRCQETPKQPNGFFIKTAFCDQHRKLYSKDILEIITSDSIQRFQNTPKNILEAEIALSKLPDADVRLDLHGVLNITEYDDTLVKDNVSVCCISYVGNLTTTRIQARIEIQERIKTGQVQYGFLVFCRDRRKGTSEERNLLHDHGSKAWVNKHIPLNGKGLFVDDIDHLKYVKSIGIDNLEYVHFDCGGSAEKMVRRKLINLLMKFHK